MIAKRIVAGASAIAAFATCAGCTAQELAAMHASTSSDDSATPAYMQTSDPFPPPPPATSSDAPSPPPMISQALDPSTGHLLTSIGPGLYMDPSNGAVFPPGTAIPLGPQ